MGPGTSSQDGQAELVAKNWRRSVIAQNAVLAYFPAHPTSVLPFTRVRFQASLCPPAGHLVLVMYRRQFQHRPDHAANHQQTALMAEGAGICVGFGENDTNVALRNANYYRDGRRNRCRDH